MKTSTSFLKRCVACLLALLMVLSVSNNGIVILTQAAAEHENSIDAGTLVANNYELTDAEKEFLSSGLLIGDSYGYSVPTDAETLIAVDTENAVITAAAYDEWVPTTAYIVANGEVVETITLTNGTGNYDPSVGNAFAVKVDYALYVTVAEDTQTALLSASAWMNQGIANTETLSGQSGNLYILEEALPELAKLVTTGIQTSFGAVGFSDDLKAAVYALNDQMTANGGMLNLRVMINEYDAGSKTDYLMNNGAQMHDEVVTFVANCSTINVTLKTMVDNLSIFIQNGWVDKTTASQLETVAGVAANLEKALTPVAEDSWDILSNNVLKDGMTAQEYAELDELVLAMDGNSTAVPAVQNPLTAAETTLQKNMSMFNVTVNVTLKVVEDQADSAALVTYDEKSLVLTMAENATAEEILAEIQATGIIADAQTAWGDAYVEAHYAAETTELPDALTEDITYAVTYAPVEYTVSFGYDAEAMTVPYGYKLTLPAHSDITKAYDYDVNGARYAQGDVVTVAEDTQISRSLGKAYVATDLYTVVANNYGNDIAKAILTSGALKGNVVIAYREPDPADAESLLKLFDGELTAENYGSNYQNLSWTPYTYGTNGDENRFDGNSAAWDSKSVKVQYYLELTNFSEGEVEEVLALAAALKAEADEQAATLNRLAAYRSTMGQLDKTKLGALNGVIDVTDFTPDDGTADDAKNLEIRAYFKGLIGGIIANNLDSNNLLKIYNILGNYQSEGLRYYYNNNEAIIAEIDSLSGYLSDMLADDEKIAALEIMVGQAGYPEYADKIADLEAIMSDVRAALSAPNAAIDLDSANLGKLMDVLTGSGTVEFETVGSPYLLSKVLTAMDTSQVMVQVILECGGSSATITTETMDRHTVLTQDIIDALKAQIDAKVSEMLGGSAAYYDLTVEGTAVEELLGTELNEQINIYYTYTAKSYTVKIDGEADQIITIDNLEVKLPKHPTNGWAYHYTVDGEENITKSTYTFTMAQLDTLFADGSYTITRTEINEAQEKLEGAFADWIVKDGNGSIVGLTVNVDGNKDGIMGFAMDMVNSGYSYIGLNGEPLLYMNEDNSLEICIQTLINAILNDNSFGSQALIDLGKNGKGQLVAASIQLGNAADDIQYSDLDFVLYLTSVPAQMGTVSNGLNSIKNYMTFQAQDGALNISLNLPEKVYEVYLSAMLPTGYVDKNDMNAVNSEIAFQFLCDYVDMVLATDADTTTFSNTLAMLNQSYDLTGYEAYYQMVKQILTSDGVEINPAEDGIFDVIIAVKGQKTIDSLIEKVGMDISAYSTYLGMIKEYKSADAELTIPMTADLVNTTTNFEALVLNLNASGMTNKFDYTTGLAAGIAAVTGKSAVILLDDVDGDLIFNGTTILDLNGKTVNGSITANGKLYIADSCLDGTNCGTVTGTVSGNAVIMGGKYASDVTAFLKDGYKQVNGVVSNALYTLESDGTDVTVVINADVLSDESVTGYLPNVRTLAVDLAVELAVNNIASAVLTAEGNVIYDVAVDDVIGLLNSSSKGDDLFQSAVDAVNAEGISAFVNIILADMLDFAAVEAAMTGNEAIATYTMTTAPWMVKIEHDTEADILKFGLASDADMPKTNTVSLKMVSESGDAVELFGNLADIMDADMNIVLEQPTYDAGSNTVSMIGNATANIDLDLTVNDDYITVLTVVLANGNPANKADLIAALNAGKDADLKDAIDELTVRDVCNALKAINENTDFLAMAENAGVSVDVADAAELEAIFHMLLDVSGELLKKLSITGSNTKLGSFDTDDDGVYECSGTTSKNSGTALRGYTVYTEASVELNLTIKLFDDCLWGDANHDGVVNNQDATLVLRYYAGLIEADELCLKRTDVNMDGVINNQDATLILRYYAGLVTELPYEA